MGLTPSPADYPTMSFKRLLGEPRAEVSVMLDEQWTVEYMLAVAPPGRLVLVGVRVLPRGLTFPPGGLTAATLRRVRIGDYLKHLEAVLQGILEGPNREKAIAGLRREGLGFLLDGPIARPQATRNSESGRSRRGRPPLSDRHLASVVAAYLAAVQRGSDRPVIDAAHQLNEEPARVRDHLHRARRRGLLIADKSGVAGGALTRQGHMLLQRKHQPARAGRRR